MQYWAQVEKDLITTGQSHINIHLLKGLSIVHKEEATL